MATTTPNFGWSVPTSTDLVKDGATAIELLGDSIDTSFVDLLGGTTGQVLTKASGTNLDFSFTTPAAGGKVLQVVTGSTSTAVTVATGTFTDTGLTATITPSAASSKVLVLAVQQAFSTRDINQAACGLRLLRAGTTIFDMDNNGGFSSSLIEHNQSFRAAIAARIPVDYVDAPNSTSALTYKIQGRPNSTDNAGSTTFQLSSSISFIILMEIGA